MKLPKFNASIQDYISLGYLYLLILGIIKDAIFHGFLGINILNYSSLIDILLSPIAYLTGHYIIPLSIIFLILLIFGVNKLNLFLYKKYKSNKWYNKLFNVKKIEKAYSKKINSSPLILFIALMIFSFYIGSGIGRGLKVSDKIKNKTYEVNKKITFNTGKQMDVYSFGINSTYLFYVTNNNNNILISPIENNISKIENLRK